MRGKPIRGSGLINAGGCRSRAQYFLILSRQMSRPEDRAAMLKMTAVRQGALSALNSNSRFSRRRSQRRNAPKQQGSLEPMAQKIDASDGEPWTEMDLRDL